MKTASLLFILLLIAGCSGSQSPIVPNDQQTQGPQLGSPDLPETGRQNIVNPQIQNQAEFSGLLEVTDKESYENFLRELSICPKTATVSSDNCIQSSNDIYVAVYDLEILRNRKMNVLLSLLPLVDSAVWDHRNTDFTDPTEREFYQRNRVWTSTIMLRKSPETYRIRNLTADSFDLELLYEGQAIASGRVQR